MAYVLTYDNILFNVGGFNMITEQQQRFLSNALQIFIQDKRIEGVAIGGSYIADNMDEFSDLDLVIVVNPDNYIELMDERKEIAGSLGHMLSCFTGEHVGEPRLLICLYGPELLHVDLKFVSLEDVHKRVEDPVILWERDTKVTDRFKLKEAKFPYPDLQWIEDRFWVWVHYGATKLGRKEIFEAIALVEHLRNKVIGPLALIKNNKLPRGVRKLEFDAANDLPKLIKTVPSYDANSCADAILVTIDIYRDLRKELADANLIIRSEAERLTVEYLDDVITRYL